MHATNSLLAITVLAVASAQAQTYEPPDSFHMPLIAEQSQFEIDAEARAVVQFWKDAGPALWFAKDENFDGLFRSKFLGAHEAAARGELAHWQSTPEGAYALVILLDQFPRNAFRGTPRMYATDTSARKAANLALAAGYDRAFPLEMRKFFALPFAHSEDMADQERSVALARRTGSDDLVHAEHHRDIIKRFGRFPHRNAILGRETTAQERSYLDNGGYTG